MSDSDPGDVESLSDALRRWKPAKLRCFAHDDSTAREVSCAQGRQSRHTLVARTALGLGIDLERIELCDPKGAILDTWRPSTLRDGDDGEPRTRAEVAAITDERLALALEVQSAVTRAIQTATDHAMDRHTKALAPVLDGFQGIVKTLMARNEQLERQTQSSIKLAYDAVKMLGRAELAMREAENAGGGEDEAPVWLKAIMGQMGLPAPTLPTEASKPNNGQS
jgi:hypothetical protein